MRTPLVRRLPEPIRRRLDRYLSDRNDRRLVDAVARDLAEIEPPLPCYRAALTQGELRELYKLYACDKLAAQRRQIEMHHSPTPLA